jgi:tryptophan 2,3-dioxygenase
MYQQNIPQERSSTCFSPAKSCLNALERAACSLPTLIERGEVSTTINGLLERHENGLADLLECGSTALKKTALLDLVMFQRALEMGAGATPPQLAQWIAQFARDLDTLPTLTYELVILSNPERAVRTFTGGQVGEIERAFYIGHQVIEHRFEELSTTLMRARDLLESGNRRAGLLLVEHGRDVLRGATESFHHGFAVMDPAAFNAFRVYLHGTSGYEGPSGLHSATIHAARFLIFGDSLGFRADFIERHRPYYPTCHKEILETGLEAVRDKRSLVDIARGTTEPDVRRTVGELSEEMRLHTAKHFGVVRRMLTDLSGPGTGGQPMGTFLRQAVDVMKEVSDELLR